VPAVLPMALAGAAIVLLLLVLLLQLVFPHAPANSADQHASESPQCTPTELVSGGGASSSSG